MAAISSQECLPSALLPGRRRFGSMVQATEPSATNPTKELLATKTAASGLCSCPYTSLGLSVRFLQHPEQKVGELIFQIFSDRASEKQKLT